MSNQPTLQRISNLNPWHKGQHKSARALLDLGVTASETCKTCPKPLWFTAFFDGTGNNFIEDGDSQTPRSVNPQNTKYSNIAKLAQFAHVERGTLPRTRFEYVEGVGTPCAKVGDSGKGIDFAAGMAAAGKGEARIRWMLNQLDDFVTTSMPFVSQINLAVFGFSRGATQARAFVRMLTEKLAYQQGDELVWVKAGLDSKQPKVVIYFVGLLDTVASVGFSGSTKETIAKHAAPIVPVIGIQLGGFLHSIDQGGHAVWANDLRIPTYVKKCVHYVAAHEVREKFPCDSVREDQVMPANCEEIFYPGVHSDVGGGYTFRCQEDRSNELSRVPLNNLYIDAWLAGVPLKDPVEVASSLFEISKDLEHHWNVYMGQGGVVGIDGPPKHDRLEAQVI